MTSIILCETNSFHFYNLYPYTKVNNSFLFDYEVTKKLLKDTQDYYHLKQEIIFYEQALEKATNIIDKEQGLVEENKKKLRKERGKKIGLSIGSAVIGIIAGILIGKL
jgi:hypothetical protein